MRTVAVVPVKSLTRAKSRLAGVLSQRERAALAERTLAHVLDVLHQAHGIAQVAVISEDPGISLPPGVTLIEQREAGLNALLEQGREWAQSIGAGALLVVFSDLPFLTPQDIEQMQSLAVESGTVVLAPDRHDIGTNCMLSRPPSAARFAFGPGSYARHRDLAHEDGLRIVEYFSEGTSVDIDTPEDLALMEMGHVIPTGGQ